MARLERPTHALKVRVSWGAYDPDAMLPGLRGFGIGIGGGAVWVCRLFGPWRPVLRWRRR